MCTWWRIAMLPSRKRHGKGAWAVAAEIVFWLYKIHFCTDWAKSGWYGFCGPLFITEKYKRENRFIDGAKIQDGARQCKNDHNSVKSGPYFAYSGSKFHKSKDLSNTKQATFKMAANSWKRREIQIFKSVKFALTLRNMLFCGRKCKN